MPRPKPVKVQSRGAAAPETGLASRDDICALVADPRPGEPPSPNKSRFRSAEVRVREARARADGTQDRDRLEAAPATPVGVATRKTANGAGYQEACPRDAASPASERASENPALLQRARSGEGRSDRGATNAPHEAGE